MSSVKDSKTTTAPQRERLRTELSRFLIDHGASVGIGTASVEMINSQGYVVAREVCLLSAVLDATQADGRIPHQLIVDGNVPIAGYSWTQRTEPKADSRFFLVAAASCLAKILRDDMMVVLADQYPSYEFHKNMGYGTEKHIAALRTQGLTPAHRVGPSTKALNNTKGFPRRRTTWRR
jgi:ribonuclease HII